MCCGTLTSRLTLVVQLFLGDLGATDCGVPGPWNTVPGARHVCIHHFLDSMSEPALATIPAVAPLIPHAKILFVKNVCGAKLLFTVRKCALCIIALTTDKGCAEPRLVQVGHLLQLVATMRKRAVIAKLADALQMVHAEPRLSQLPMKA